MTKPSTTATQRSLREVIADDSHALTFQTSGQYRAALLKHQPMEHTHHAEAFAWAVFAKDDNVIIWSKNRAQVESASKEYGRPIVPVIALFAAEQGAPPVPPTHCDPAEGFCAKCQEQARAALANQPASTVPAGDSYNRKLEKALRPFAKLAKPFEGNFDTDHIMQDYRGTLTVRHIRAAAKALAHQSAQEQAEPTTLELVHALLQAERLLRAAGFSMTGTASSQIVAAIAKHAVTAQQEPVATPQQAAAPKVGA
ncbi:hypothetical protein IFU00_01270 [Oxalobacteraceae sp. CFBP 8761]|nr:hypothetical protein [Oxalobacteraceae sp. CFBP 8761]